MNLEIIFFLAIATVIYAYFGYGILIVVLNKIPFIKKIIPQPKNAIPTKVNSDSSLPKVSLIISASGESAKTIQEKIDNIENLKYPSDKLEVFFAVAYDDNKVDETIEEYYKLHHPVVDLNLNPVEESAFVYFYNTDKIDKTDTVSLGVLEKQLTRSSYFSDQIRTDIYERLKSIQQKNNYKFEYHVTKDIVRKGKISQVNRTVKKAEGDIVVFSDANTLFNSESILNLVKHFKDESVGCVAGEKRVKKGINSTSGESEGLYWKYESFLKKMDSKLYSAVGAAGEIYAVRRELLENGINENAIIEDFVLSMKIARKGYKIKYEPNAYAEEEPTVKLEDEFKRKKRIIAGGFQSIVWLFDLLNPFKYGVLTFQYFSHRVLRWAAVPFLLPLILVTNFMLLDSGLFIYHLTLAAQIFFYLLALLGFFFEKKHKKVKLFNISLYFVLMNVAAYFGFVKFVTGSQSVIWERVNR